MKKIYTKFLAATFALSLISNEALACACGCGIFGVGTSSLIPSEQGGTAFLQYDYINQSRNWSKEKQASSDNNEDKQIKSQVVTAGMQYMFNRQWGVAARVPYVTRSAKSSMMDGNGDTMNHFARVNSIGDIRINGIYSGFSDDMSSGITFGLKLPTGQSNAKGFHSRDMQIGTGTTDSLLGAYHMGKIIGAEKWNWFAQGNWQHAVNSHNRYRPGDEFSAASGVYYNAGSFLGVKKVAPIFQVTGSKKSHDTGLSSNAINSGYSHAYFAPALELNFGKFKTYADVEFPIYQNTRGNQLVPNRIYKFILGYGF